MVELREQLYSTSVSTLTSTAWCTLISAVGYADSNGFCGIGAVGTLVTSEGASGVDISVVIWWLSSAMYKT